MIKRLGKSYQVKALRELALYFALFLCVFGLSIFRFGPHYDEVLDYSGQAIDTYTALGRWGIVLYRNVFSVGFSPWASPMMTGIFLSLAIYVQVRLFQLNHWKTKFVYAGMLLASYQTIYLLRYSIQSDAVAFSILATTVSAYLLLGRAISTRISILVILLLSLCIGIYQISAAFFISVVFIYMLQDLLKNRKIPSIKQSFYLGLILGCAVVLSWLVISKYTKPYADATVLEYYTDYLKDQSTWDSFFDANISLKIISTLHFLKVWILQAIGIERSAQGFFYLQTESYLYTTVLIPLLYLAFYIYKRYGLLHFLIGFFLLVSLWLSPFALTFAMRKLSGIHSGLAEPMVQGIFWALAYMYRPHCLREGRSGKMAQIAALGLTSLCLISNTYLVSEHERMMAQYATQLESTLLQLEDYRIARSYEAQQDTHIVIMPAVGNEDISVGYNLAPFCQKMYLDRTRSVEQAEVEELRELARSMPYWPAVGSVLERGDHCYIKVSSPWVGRPVKEWKL